MERRGWRREDYCSICGMRKLDYMAETFTVTAGNNFPEKS